MKLPLSWLNDYVDVDDLAPGVLAEKLTFAGIEVEGVETSGSDYAGLVVGEVVALAPHPNADRLRLCRVFDGDATHAVVCGAANFVAGDKAAFARVGTVLPDGVKLRKAKIRGEISSGMLCASDELGLSDDHSGIVLFDRTTAAGTPLSKLLPGPETVLDLELTWNRPDWLSMIGMARECAAILRRPLRIPPVELPTGGTPIAAQLRVFVDDPQGCPRYTARLISEVDNGPSPQWMRRRLDLCGVRPINAVVDVTNYVMLECGQPLHAFDLEKLRGGVLRVRRALPGEVLDTLDGVTRPLDHEILVIPDDEAPVAVAGVMGGAGSEIAEKTRTVVLESATFDAPRVKQAGNRLAMRTESSHRFERGVDPELAEWASRRAAALMGTLGHATVAPGILDADYRRPARREVTLRHRRVEQVMGMPLSAETMSDILSSLGLERMAGDDEHSRWKTPSWRADLEIEADLIEEVARMHGLDALPELAPSAPVVSELDDRIPRVMAQCGNLLSSMGFSEAIHYSFVSDEQLDAASCHPPAQRVRLPNPVRSDHNVLRDMLLPQLIETLGRNHARQAPWLAMYEIGRVFAINDAGATEENTHLAFGLYGPMGRPALDRRRPVSSDEAMLWLKGAVERLAEGLHAGAPRLIPSDAAPFQPGWGARIEIDGLAVGWIGLVTDALRHHWRLHAPMAVAELRMAPLIANADAPRALSPVPAYPSVTRDLALVAKASVSHAQIVDTIRQFAPKELTHVALFDMFKPSEKDRNQRLLAYSLEYRSAARTLTDDEVNAYQNTVLDALRDELGVEIRER